MDSKDIKSIVDQLASHIEEQVKTTIYEHGVLKDKEVSGLHREINAKLGALTSNMEVVSKTVSNHDEVIQELRQLYKTAGTIKKFFITIIVGVPSLAAFVAGVAYIYHVIFPLND